MPVNVPAGSRCACICFSTCRSVFRSPADGLPECVRAGGTIILLRILLFYTFCTVQIGRPLWSGSPSAVISMPIGFRPVVEASFSALLLYHAPPGMSSPRRKEFAGRRKREKNVCFVIFILPETFVYTLFFAHESPIGESGIFRQKERVFVKNRAK